MSTDNSKLYDIQITFHSAHDLPVSDVPSLSADPYILASLRDQDNTSDARSGLGGGEVWRVGGVRDEDAGKKDDRLGEARVSFFGTLAPKKLKGDDSERDADLDWGHVREGLDVARREAPIKKRRGGARMFLSTYVTAAISLSENQEDRRVYTLGPNYYSLHFSPLLGKVMGMKSANTSGAAKPTVSNFQANKLQLTGPVPKDLEHRYVGYRPFIESLFSKRKLMLTPNIYGSGIKGRILNRALKKQHRYVYSHDQATVYGCVERHQHASNVGSNNTGSQPRTSQSSSPADVNPLAAQFLRMVQYGAGHRLYTYAITLDAQWRFTETGDEFAIEMLSKHSMHADAARYIAYSGEMFVRRIGTQGWEDDELAKADSRDDEKKLKKYPPSAYELVIDNDSGTYRPHKELLPLLAEFLRAQANLGGPGGLGKITAIDGFDEGLKDTKKRRAEAKKSQSGERETRQVQIRRGSSVSSVGSVSSGEVERVVREGTRAGEGGGRQLEGETGEVKGSGEPEEHGEVKGGEAKQDVGKVMGEMKDKVAEGKRKVEEVKAGVAGVTEEQEL
ncbi:hypothetical protein FRC06_006387 [Ceratobasidium sp. 370]|nr:hypothetical protein FRC06_006387 [Ceratobasidium sp. 370]